MTPDYALIELIERLGARHGAAVLVSEHELTSWASEAVAAMKSQGLLRKARPSASAVCPGCERECTMPVQILTEDEDTDAFIVCDKRSDINRVPISITNLEQWQISGDSVADLLAKLLGINRSCGFGTDAARWEIGLLKVTKHSGHLVFTADGKLTLSLAGHCIALVEILSLDIKTLTVDKRKLTYLVDHPTAGGGDLESAAQRRERLKKRVRTLKDKGIKAFLKTVAVEEGISVSRLKQLLQEENEPKPLKSRW